MCHQDPHHLPDTLCLSPFLTVSAKCQAHFFLKALARNGPSTGKTHSSNIIKTCSYTFLSLLSNIFSMGPPEPLYLEFWLDFLFLFLAPQFVQFHVIYLLQIHYRVSFIYMFIYLFSVFISPMPVVMSPC